MSLLAIDPGTNCGWAIKKQTGDFVSGTWNLRGGRYEGGGMRFLRLEKFLNEVRASTPIQMVVFEEVRRHLGTDAAHIYGGIVATVCKWCEENKIPYLGIPVGTVKRNATGKGNANKEQMIAAAQARWPGHVFVDDNEADARWIAESVGQN